MAARKKTEKGPKPITVKKAKEAIEKKLGSPEGVEAPKAKEKAPKGGKKAKKEGRPVLNLNDYVAKGWDVWMRPCEFDHSHVEVLALCLIAPDKKSYQVLNTYDGRPDRDTPSTFQFKDEKAIQKKLADLMKREYFVYEPAKAGE